MRSKLPPAAASAVVTLLALSGPVGCQEGEGHRDMRFEDAETWARVWDDPSRDEWQKPAEVIGFLAPTDGAVLVDLGAGTGYFLPHLSRAAGPGGRVLALDIEPDMVRHMTERVAREGLANVEVRKVGPDDPGLDPESVDGILIVDTWHHIVDRSGYAARLGRSLRPGGRVLVVDYTLDSPSGPPVEARLSEREVCDDFRAAGFEVEVLSETLPRQYAVSATRPG